MNTITRSLAPSRAGTRDAIVIFQCYPAAFVQVCEILEGKSLSHEPVKRHPSVVNELEVKYMFYANQADIARKKIMHGQSCRFDVYVRFP